MHSLAEGKSLNNKDIVVISQELDSLLNEYYEIKGNIWSNSEKVVCDGVMDNNFY